MNRNWDIMRNAANGSDPYGTTSRMDETRMRDRERFTSRDREEGWGGARMFDGIPDYQQSRLGTHRRGERDWDRDERWSGRGYVGSYGDEGFGRHSQGWGNYAGNQGQMGSQRFQGGQGFQSQGYGNPRYAGYGYEHFDGDALGQRGQYGEDERRFYDRVHDHGLIGRIEQGIDRAFGRDWDHDNRRMYEQRYGQQRSFRGDYDDHPSLWDRVKGAFTGRGPKNWTRSDERIREDVCECLTYHPHIDASEIEIVVKDGEVTLTGNVHDRASKRLAEDIVEDVRGVKDVHNQIRVQRQTTQQLGTQNVGQTQTGGTTTTTNQAWNQARR